MLDSSRSVTVKHFNRQKDFVKSILKQFPVGPEETQAGIIKYGRTADVEINFDDFSTERDLFDALDSVKHAQASETRLDLALKVARDKLFTAARGARGGNVKKVRKLFMSNIKK